MIELLHYQKKKGRTSQAYLEERSRSFWWWCVRLAETHGPWRITWSDSCARFHLSARLLCFAWACYARPPAAAVFVLHARRHHTGSCCRRAGLTWALFTHPAVLRHIKLWQTWRPLTVRVGPATCRVRSCRARSTTPWLEGKDKGKLERELWNASLRFFCEKKSSFYYKKTTGRVGFLYWKQARTWRDAKPSPMEEGAVPGPTRGEWMRCIYWNSSAI
jgi:hypothetical protein